MKNITDIIKLIECFEDEQKFYWIDKLKISKALKGYLIIHFKLI